MSIGRFLALALIAALAGAPALADPAPPPTPLSASDKALVQRGVDYIDAIAGLEGRFIQTDPRGRVSNGRFYLQRPGRARFQYDPPAQMLVVADGTNFSVYDRQLKSFDQSPLAQTPLAWLLAKPFRLDHGVAILSVDRRPGGGFSIVAGDARRRGPGRLTLQFSEAPLALAGWSLIDPQGQRTDVRLSALKARAALDPKLFVLKDPKAHVAAPNVAY